MSRNPNGSDNQRSRVGRLERLEDRVMLAADGFEQEFVYLLNAARNNPSAYQAARNLPVNLSNVVPRGPLAVNDTLYDSAETKATDMTSNNYFSHVSPGGVHANAIVRSAGYPLPSSYPDNTNFVESLAGGTQYDNAADVLDLLVIDAGLATPSHRIQLLGMDDFQAANREIGVGLSSSTNASFTNYWAIHIARQETSANHLTGVVFDDADGDGAYDRGEGLSNVQISASGATTASVRTNPAGGWSVAAEDGVHSIVARGSTFTGVSTATATVSGENVAVDFISGNVASQVAFTQHFGSNPVDRFDVNGREGADTLDALQLVNHIASTRSNAASELVLLDVETDSADQDNALLEVTAELEHLAITSRPTKLVQQTSTACSQEPDAALLLVQTRATTLNETLKTRLKELESASFPLEK